MILRADYFFSPEVALLFDMELGFSLFPYLPFETLPFFFDSSTLAR